MNFQIPNVDPYVISTVKELFRWVGDNQYFLYLLMYLLRELKVQALQSKNVVDDRIITLLIYIFSFQWLTKLKSSAKNEG